MRNRDDLPPGGNSVTGFIKGWRILLRAPMSADLPLIVKWYNDPDITKYTKGAFPFSEVEAEDWLANLYKSYEKNIVFIIVYVETGLPIGTTGLFGINSVDVTASTGIVIGETALWAKGLATEAKMLLLDYAFNTRNLRKISSSVCVYEFNQRALALNKKTGYKIEGVLKKQVFKNGDYYDEVQMAVFKEDWSPLWAAFRSAQSASLDDTRESLAPLLGNNQNLGSPRGDGV